MNELALFAGVGGGILGGHLLGWRTVCAVEYDPYAAGVLCARQNDGVLSPFPIWDDVRTFDGRPWRGIVDVVSGGFPCQDISVAGKGAGINGSRSGLWGEMARIVDEVRPRYVFVENSPMLVGRGLARVLGDLASLGYDARWCIVSASDVGAPHKRDRIWILATDFSLERTHSDQIGRRTRRNQKLSTNPRKWAQSILHVGTVRTRQSARSRSISNTYGLPQQQPQRLEQNQWRRTRNLRAQVPNTQGAGFQTRTHRQGQVQSRRGHRGRVQWWAAEPNVGRVADGVPARMDRLKALGNAQVPLVAAVAWRILMGEVSKEH